MHSSLPKIASRAKALLATLAMTGTSAVIAAEGAGKGGFSEKASLGELVEFQFTGLLVVFVVLGSLTVLSYLIGWLLKRIAPDQYHGKAKASHTSAPVAKAPAPAPVPAPKPAPAATPPAAPATIHPGLTDEQLMAILAVAATEALGQAVAVVSFRPLGSMDWTWSIQGRVQHHTSHAL
jgi:Na+-transporting methylmalonyl-CoA/oxaloacetate decarboxylase gamma subunit